jgi:hypothetical protein
VSLYCENGLERIFTLEIHSKLNITQKIVQKYLIFLNSIPYTAIFFAYSLLHRKYSELLKVVGKQVVYLRLQFVKVHSC